MPDPETFGLFLAAAFALAVIPGPGMLYVLARTLRGGRREGVLSTLGTATAGLIHTVAAALGVSALLATSAEAFTVVKWLGAGYLVFLGVRALLERPAADGALPDAPAAPRGAFRQGVITEALNPKTALFFLAFVPQFVALPDGGSPGGTAFGSFVLLGAITTLLTSGADLAVVASAAPLGRTLRRSPRLRRLQRVASGGTLIGLGLVAAARE